MNLQAFTALKERLEQAEAEQHRIEGALKQTLIELKKRFGCKTLDEAEKLLAKKKKELEGLEADYDKAERAYQRKWGEKLDGRS